MFGKEDFKLPPDPVELLEILPILIFVALVLPFVAGAYKLGFVMDKLGWLDRA